LKTALTEIDLYKLFKQIGKISAAIVLTACSTLASAQLGSASTDLVYTPVTPCRIIDTRSAPAGQMAAGLVRSFNAWTTTNFTNQGGLSSDCNIPANTNTAAIVVYFTVVAPSAAGYITTYPSNAPQPLASTVNFGGGDVKGNNATLKLNQTVTSSHFNVFTSSATHLVADVVGYYAKPVTVPMVSLNSDLVYTPVTPCRIIDTRNPAADTGVLVGGSPARSFVGWNDSYTLQGGDNSNCGLPLSINNAAIVVNFAVVGPSTDGYITAYPADKTQPFAATVNFVAGDVKGNNTVLKLNQTTDQAEFKVYSSSTTHLVADVVGYYATPVAIGSLSSDLVYTPITPCRIVDTRNVVSGAFTALSTRNFIGWGTSFAAQGGAANDCGLPRGVDGPNNAALAVNFAIVGPAADGYITAFPANATTMPLAATLNYYAGDVKANNTVLKLSQTTGTGPHFKIYSTSTSHLIADVVGYYAKPKP
jgi:hypothetical protein